MRSLVAVTLLLCACELPSGSLPPRAVPFDLLPPQPLATVTQTFHTTSRDGAPVSTVLDVVLDTAARRLGMRLGATAQSAGTDSLRVTTGADGLAEVAVTYGPRAGTARLLLRTPEAADEVVYEFPAGDVRRLLAWATVAAYAGDTLTVRWETRDATGRRVFGDPAVTVLDTAVASLITADAALAKRTGSTWARVVQGALADSVPIAVVPHGRLGARAVSTWKDFDLDGTGQSTGFGTALTFAGPRYSPSGDSLAYTESGHVRLRTPAPVTTQPVPAALGFTADQSPCWSADGRWLYFTGVTATESRSEIWRIHPDGTGAERVGPLAATGENDDQASVTADGSLLAFTTNRSLDGGAPTVRVIATSSGAVVWAGPAGSLPRFSPDGTTLAFNAGGALFLAHSDGTGLRRLVPALTGFSGQLAWSPDSRWLAVARPDSAATPPYLYLVDTDTDVAIRLPYTFGWAMPDWAAGTASAGLAPRSRAMEPR
jgi:hypothetical protein